jgi:hypothetical protein
VPAAQQKVQKLCASLFIRLNLAVLEAYIWLKCGRFIQGKNRFPKFCSMRSMPNEMKVSGVAGQLMGGHTRTVFFCKLRAQHTSSGLCRAQGMRVAVRSPYDEPTCCYQMHPLSSWEKCTTSPASKRIGCTSRLISLTNRVTVQ